jgi:transglutaminase/protease-like cytokinesis protein 3
VVKHVTYDQSLQSQSDYDAFSSGSAMCQGYVLLIDRMLAMAGIEVKIVVGTTGGTIRAWNLARFCNAWFHLDASLDNPAGMAPGYVSWDYFNLSDAEMGTDHSWINGDYPAAAAA